MTLVIALAGLAEAGEFLSIMLWRVLMIVALLIAIWGFVRRSKKKAWIAFGIGATVVAIVQPWWDFVGYPPSPDPDVDYWLSRWKAFSIELSFAFPICFAIVLATFARVSNEKDLTNRLRQGPQVGLSDFKR